MMMVLIPKGLICIFRIRNFASVTEIFIFCKGKKFKCPYTRHSGHSAAEARNPVLWRYLVDSGLRRSDAVKTGMIKNFLNRAKLPVNGYEQNIIG
jgi:hypothetical protein